jgi:eukaryotic-like serine/threonine-protein kinase
MTPEEWHEVKQVLQTALELPPELRESFLDSACPREGSIRSEVESLLRSHDEDEIFLERSVAVSPASLLDNAPSPCRVGGRLGPYKLLDQIGEGGMGAVFRALRADGLYDKQVAIKIIRSGLSSEFFLSRFRNERQILARLEHPNIARLLEGGITEEGSPYVVLEYVAGLPIDKYCEHHELSIAERLKLFRTVCSAVQYAHQNLIVHRDLKPGNILVTEDGTPKLLDFGIAKMLDPKQEETRADRTETLLRIMTPDFASPEQVRGESITTASDIYSLGVILYLLLTGRKPYRLSSTAPHEIMKAICDTDPERPSTAITRCEEIREKNDSPTKITEASRLDPKREKLRRLLAGDLDNIVLKALRKEPDRRYATIEQFSEDVRRHLEHLPVIARKETPFYLGSKFILRHKVGVAVTMAAALTLIIALAITVHEGRIARAERARAELRFNDVRSLANSLIFDVHDSIKDLPGSTPARKIIVDRALRYLNSLARESSDDLGLQRELATAYERVGQVQGLSGYDNLGDPAGSLASYEKALAIRKQVDRRSEDWKDRLALVQDYRSVAELQWGTGNAHQARDNLDRGIIAAEALNQAHPNEPQLLHEIAGGYRDSGSWSVYPDPPGAAAKRIEDYRKALTADEAALTSEPDDLSMLSAYGADLSHIGNVLEPTDPQAALPYYQRELGILQKVSQASSAVGYGRRVALAYRDLSSVYDDLGDHPKAAENAAKALTLMQELTRADPQNASLRHSLAIAYANDAAGLAEIGDMELALQHWEKGAEIMRKLVSSATENRGERHYLGAILTTGGTLLMQAHKLQAALAQFEEARAIYQSFRDAGNASTFEIANVAACSEKMGEASALAGDSRAAANYFHQALTVAEPLISAKPVEENALYAAADAYSGLGDLSLKRAQRAGQTISERKANWTDARSWYVKSLETWRRIEHPNRFAPGTNIGAGNPKLVEKKQQKCQTELSHFD